MTEARSRDQQIADIESQLAGLSPQEALKKASELASVKPAPVQSFASPEVKVEEVKAEVKEEVKAEAKPEAPKAAELTPEQKLAKYEEDKIMAERKALAIEEHNRNLAKEHERLKAELAKTRKEMLVKTRPETLERIDGLEESIKHVIESREAETIPDTAQPVVDDGIERFRAVVEMAHPDAYDYLKREDVSRRAAPYFESVGEDWVNRPLDLIREITKLKIEDASQNSNVYKQELEALKTKMLEMEKKSSRSAELAAMTSPAGGRSVPISSASAGEDFVKSINDMSPADFRAYTEKVIAGK